MALGLDLDTIALSGAQWAKVMALFASAGVLPREDGNVIVSGQFPTNLLGYTWVTSPNIVGSDPLLVDREQLGGMADEGGTAQLELRASWTPVQVEGPMGVDVAPHVEAWGELLCTAVGLEPVPEGVTAIPSRRGQRGPGR